VYKVIFCWQKSKRLLISDSSPQFNTWYILSSNISAISLGSTNSDEFLTDVTGSVRWLCFEVEEINWNYDKEIPIDRLWAQAYHLLLNKFKYQLTPEEQIQNEVSNQRHKIQSIEEELISSKYSPGTSEDNDAFMQTSQIMKEIIISEPYLSNKITEHKVGRALKGLLFKKESKRVEGFSNPTKGFYVKFKN
jgi:hypothetical protein